MANTVPACFWTLYHLLTHPAALRLVRQEILDVLELAGTRFSSDRDVTLSREQLDQLLYLGECETGPQQFRLRLNCLLKTVCPQIAASKRACDCPRPP